MILEQNCSLKPYNTFGIEASAEKFIRIYNESTIQDILKNKYQPIKILGGGSNILLTQNVKSYVLKNEIKGINIISEDDDNVIVEAGAGEEWHQFVMWTLSHQLGGLENLSLIPGTVGAAPMQNIGAYGIEQESCFVSLSAINLTDGSLVQFDKKDCHFGYRESVFKNECKDNFFITRVQYRLKKHPHILHLEYGAIQDMLKSKNIISPTIRDVSAAIIEIRKSKLPDPAVIGNAGSFFKNPVVNITLYQTLKLKYPEIPSYKVNDEEVKIPAGWLIEKTGYKGKIYGNIGVHKDQALVIVNFGGGQGVDIKNLSTEIQKTVFDIFSINIHPEVNIW